MDKDGEGGGDAAAYKPSKYQPPVFPSSHQPGCCYQKHLINGVSLHSLWHLPHDLAVFSNSHLIACSIELTVMSNQWQSKRLPNPFRNYSPWLHTWYSRPQSTNAKNVEKKKPSQPLQKRTPYHRQDHTQQAVPYPLAKKIACHANKGIDGPMSQDLATTTFSGSGSWSTTEKGCDALFDSTFHFAQFGICLSYRYIVVHVHIIDRYRFLLLPCCY